MAQLGFIFREGITTHLKLIAVNVGIRHHMAMTLK